MSAALPDPQEHSSAGESDLFSSVRLGAYLLANRIVMAPRAQRHGSRGRRSSMTAATVLARMPIAGARTAVVGVTFAQAG